tara:strand:+ start:2535 stop:3335 length:801 start_codon:yes stop_codon:yes gene_type:complete
MNKILIVGKKSLIANNFYNFLKKKTNVKLIDFKKLNIKNKTFTIINCSSKKNMNKKNQIDRDIKIINKLIKKNNTFHYIMLSTSKVYGGGQSVKKEAQRCKPNCVYGKHRLKVENIIKKLLPENNFTILRLSNVVNLDLRKKSNSKTFINKMLCDLKFKNFIEIPKKFVFKDFIDEDNLYKIINMVIKKKVFGLFNLSSGIPTSTNEMAKNILKGYGKGMIIKNKNLKTDSFVLSSKSLFDKLNYKITKNDLNLKFVKLGKILKNV